MISFLDAPGMHAMALRLQESQILPSATVLVAQREDGQLLQLRPDVREWEHPWHTRAFFADNAWHATVTRPGLVNGIDPTVPGVTLADGEEAVLTDYPAIRLNGFRTPGGENDRILDFFLALGVPAPEGDEFRLDDLGVQMVIGNEAPAALPPRQLLACDLYLARARASLQASLTLVDASGTSGVIVDYAAAYDTTRLDQVGARARLLQAAKFPAITQPSVMDRLMGNFSDEGEDRLPVCTVFLLSPPNFQGEPDASWTPFVQHHAFWNLRCNGRQQITATVEPIRFHSGLAAGLGDLVINQYLALDNDLFARLTNALNNSVTEGDWATAA